MTSRQHQDWINHGKPDSGLALPLQLLANTLAAAGYTVYVYPNDAHLDAEPPEDHTYYSETGWPNRSPKWWRHAIDIMPPPSGRGLPSLTELGQRIFNARQAGQITWLKYMNWPSDGNLDRAVQDRWEPNHSRGTSSDTGHIHLSSITGVETLDSSFNPLTSVVLTGVVTPEDDMSALFTDNLARELDALFNAKDTVLLDTGGGVMKSFPVPLVALLRQTAAPAAPVTLTDAQVSALAADVVAGLASQAPAAQLTAAQVADELAKRLLA